MDKQTEMFLNGYNSYKITRLAGNPHIFSSDNWLLHDAGQRFELSPFSTPIRAKKSRGFSVRIFTNDNEFLMTYKGEILDQVTLERK